MRLLIVEDEDAIRTAFGRALATGGNEVRTAASLTEARTVAAEFHPEALLSDLKLPDGSGLDFAGELGVPFILMSGYAAFDDAVSALRMGCVDFFTKPVAIKDLRSALNRLGTRMRTDALQVVAATKQGMVRVQPAGVRLIEDHFRSRQLAWSSTDEAHQQFLNAGDLVRDDAQRQVLGELLQACPSGELTLNHGDGWWTVWLAADVDWTTAQRDRRNTIEALAERCVWRPGGALVECSDD